MCLHSQYIFRHKNCFYLHTLIIPLILPLRPRNTQIISCSCSCSIHHYVKDISLTILSNLLHSTSSTSRPDPALSGHSPLGWKLHTELERLQDNICYIHTHTHTRTHTRTHTHYINTHACMEACSHMHCIEHMHAYTRTHTNTYKQMNIRLHAHTNTRTCKDILLTLI